MAAALAVLLASSSARAQSRGGACPEGRAPVGDLGIAELLCRGGTCEIWARDADGGLTHRFSVEPRIRALSPAAKGGMLRVGDALVAVDAVLTTTRGGGRVLANLPTGPVSVLVRRGGRLLLLRVPATAGCGVRRLLVLSSAEADGER